LAPFDDVARSTPLRNLGVDGFDSNLYAVSAYGTDIDLV